ncbi:hypothetical protein BJX65DRAFT_305681 [Aspergillus insuetus]
MTTGKPTFENVSLVEPAKPSRVSRLKTHFRTWWWAHLVALSIIVLVITLPLVYVGYPNIAQDEIDKSTLSVLELTISEPSPDGFQLYQKQIIGSRSIFHPRIHEFSSEVGLGGASSSFATVTIPGMVARDNTALTVQQWVPLANRTAFTDFAIAALTQETFGLSIFGKPKLKLGGLPTITVTYQKLVTLTGFNNLKGFKVVSMLFDSNLPNGNNAKGTVYIPNPTLVTLSLGTLTMDLSSNGTFLGNATVNDLVLKPGNNTVPMLSALDQERLIGIISELPESTYRIPLTVVGKSSVYDGQEIPYFTAAFSATTLQIELDVLDVLGG